MAGSDTEMTESAERRPDIIQSTLTGKRFEKVSPRLNRIVHRGEMEAGLLNHPDFMEEYLFVRNAPYAVRDRAIFVRRSFWAAHPLRDMMRCVPVTQTAIYPRN